MVPDPVLKWIQIRIRIPGYILDQNLHKKYFMYDVSTSAIRSKWQGSNQFWSACLHCKKILFTTAVRRIFAALVMEKPCLSTETFFPAPIALFYDSIGRKKFQPLRWFFPLYNQEIPGRKFTFLKLSICRKIPAYTREQPDEQHYKIL